MGILYIRDIFKFNLTELKQIFSFDSFLNLFITLQFDEDLLAILISILEKMDSASLQTPIDTQMFSDVSYNMVLDGLREMQKGFEPAMSQEVEFFNKLLTDWARTYDEERVDDRMLDVIYEAAYYLARLFARSIEADVVKDDYEVLHAPKPSADGRYESSRRKK